MPDRPSSSSLFNASGRARELRASPLFAGAAALAALRSNLTFSSVSARHGIRIGAALAAGVAAYRYLGLHQHGLWIPLTILFVMRPDRDKRLVLRALGIAIAFLAWRLWPNPRGAVDLAGQPNVGGAET